MKVIGIEEEHVGRTYTAVLNDFCLL